MNKQPFVHENVVISHSLASTKTRAEQRGILIRGSVHKTQNKGACPRRGLPCKKCILRSGKGIFENENNKDWGHGDGRVTKSFHFQSRGLKIIMMRCSTRSYLDSPGLEVQSRTLRLIFTVLVKSMRVLSRTKIQDDCLWTTDKMQLPAML